MEHRIQRSRIEPTQSWQLNLDTVRFNILMQAKGFTMVIESRAETFGMEGQVNEVSVLEVMSCRLVSTKERTQSG